MNAVSPVELRRLRKGEHASSSEAYSYIVVTAPHDSVLLRSDADGLFEPNLMPPDELWNNPAFLQNVVRPAIYDLECSSVPEQRRGWLPTTFARIANAPVAGLVKPSRPLEIRASTPIGIWKGVVRSVDQEQRLFSADLTPLRGSDVQVSGDVSFEQINEDDLVLVQPGAVFYLEQYARTVKRQVSSDTIVRFRRGNAWTEQQAAKVSELSTAFAGAMAEGRAKVRVAD